MSQLKSIDSDVITLRRIFIKSPDNSNIPLNHTLISDGNGGAYWSTLSSAGVATSFQRITVAGKNYDAVNTGYGIGITAGPGIGFLTASSNSFGIYSKGFTKIQVKDGNAVEAATNTLYPTINMEGIDGIEVIGNPDTHTIQFRGAAPAAISTGIYGYYQVASYSNASTINSNFFSTTEGATVHDATSASSILRFAGLGDIILTSDYTNRATYIGISSFTSETYNQTVSTVSTLFSRTMSTVSTLFVDNPTFTSSLTGVDTKITSLSNSVTGSLSAVYNQLTSFLTINEFQSWSTAVGPIVGIDLSTVSTYFVDFTQLDTRLNGYVSTVTFTDLSTTYLSTVSSLFLDLVKYNAFSTGISSGIADSYSQSLSTVFSTVSSLYLDVQSFNSFSTGISTVISSVVADGMNTTLSTVSTLFLDVNSFVDFTRSSGGVAFLSTVSSLFIDLTTFNAFSTSIGQGAIGVSLSTVSSLFVDNVRFDTFSTSIGQGAIGVSLSTVSSLFVDYVRFNAFSTSYLSSVSSLFVDNTRFNAFSTSYLSTVSSLFVDNTSFNTFSTSLGSVSGGISLSTVSTYFTDLTTFNAFSTSYLSTVSSLFITSNYVSSQLSNYVTTNTFNTFSTAVGTKPPSGSFFISTFSYYTNSNLPINIGISQIMSAWGTVNLNVGFLSTIAPTTNVQIDYSISILFGSYNSNIGIGPTFRIWTRLLIGPTLLTDSYVKYFTAGNTTTSNSVNLDYQFMLTPSQNSLILSSILSNNSPQFGIQHYIDYPGLGGAARALFVPDNVLTIRYFNP